MRLAKSTCRQRSASSSPCRSPVNAATVNMRRELVIGRGARDGVDLLDVEAR